MNTVRTESAATEVYESSVKKSKNYGRTIGQPQLSEKAEKYYQQLKSKFSDMDFVLVSEDQKATAQAQAASYANPNRTIVLINEDKLERMAEDEAYRNKYEGIIRNSSSQLAQLQSRLSSSVSGLVSFGIQVDDGGNASFFAVVDKSLAAQKERIEKAAEKKSAAKKAEARKDAKKKAEKREKERTEEKRRGEAARTETQTVWGSSIDDLLRKLENLTYAEWSDQVMTDAERQVGQHFDFRG